ncbi:MAG: DUF1553 domain-containing protein [Acidobacteria bacterium]|nr:DUF1553 domain-containing protein [Acidobacteriota bacterium]
MVYTVGVRETQNGNPGYDVVDEQIDTTGKAFLGLTLGCARCHDHKFDPIPTADYYGLAGIFASSVNFRALGRAGAVSYIHYSPLDADAFGRYQAHRWRMYSKQLELEESYSEDLIREGALHRPRLGEIQDKAWLAKHKLDGLKPAELQEKLTVRWEESLLNWRRRFATEVVVDRTLPERPKPDEANPFLPGGPLALKETPRTIALRAEYEMLKKTLPPEPPMASAVAEGVAVDQHIFQRGDHLSPGAPVAKHFPTAVSWGPQTPVPSGSGRRELAEWIAHPRNPLTARVYVNRVWQGHFGEGLMRTPNNWGLMADAPSHPELLDFLASRFIAGGWSVKNLHRLIVHSEAYQRSSRVVNAAADPANRQLSHFPRLRLGVEQIRDGLLAIDGTLDETVGGAPGARERMKPDELTRRTLYTTVRRGSVPALLATFDYGDATTVSEGRARTNVAPQALFLRNSAFVNERAKHLAAKLGPVPAGRERVERLYLLTLSRPPDAGETDAALSYLAAMTTRAGETEAWQSFCRVLFASNEFLYLP